MSIEQKQNIKQIGRLSLQRDSRRNSTYSQSACKKLLINICEDEIYKQKKANIGENIKQIKLKQIINILQKKIIKQVDQINMLTININKLNKIKIQEDSIMKEEIQKIKKNKIDKNEHNTIIKQLKKKNIQLNSINNEFLQKNNQLQNKIMKLKQILRKKQIYLNDLKNKIQNDKCSTLQQLVTKQKQQLITIKQKYQKSKQCQSKFQKQLQLLKIKLTQHKNQNTTLKTQTLTLQQSNKRLTHKSQQLQKYHQEFQKQSNRFQDNMKKVINQQNQQINKLKQIIDKIKTIQQQKQNNQFLSIYKQQILKVLKNHINDKNVIHKILNIINQIIQDMENSMNRVLMQLVTNHI